MNASAFTLPADINAAAASLGRLGELATATEWKRAAIVATFVHMPGKRRGRSNESVESRSLETPKQFARRGIVGLASDQTVYTYARAWLDRYDRPAPGQRIDLPDEAWPQVAGHRPGTGTTPVGSRNRPPWDCPPYPRLEVAPWLLTRRPRSSR